MGNYQYGIAVNNRVFMHVDKDRAQEAFEQTQFACSDPSAVTLLRREVGEWEEIDASAL